MSKGKGQKYLICLLVGMAWGLWLVARAVAQDGAPVPPLEAGLVLTLHPVFVHFAVALTVWGCVLDCAGSVWHRPGWQRLGRPSFFAGVGALGLAVLSGWIEQQLPQPNSAFDAQIQDLLVYHEYLGYGLFGFFLVLAVVRTQIAGRLPLFFVLLTGLGLAGLVVQGHWGGELVYRYGTGVRAVHILSQPVPTHDNAPERVSGASGMDE